MSKLKFIPSPNIAGAYEVVNTEWPIILNAYQQKDVDLRKITLEQADEMFKAGSRYLRKIAAKKTKDTPKG